MAAGVRQLAVGRRAKGVERLAVRAAIGADPHPLGVIQPTRPRRMLGRITYRKALHDHHQRAAIRRLARQGALA
jgi:hypothetical protein